MQFKSASQAIHDAYALGFKNKGLDVHRMLTADFKSSRGYKDRNWQHVDECESGLILLALAELQPHLQDWAVWCHGPRVAEYLPEQGRFFEWLNQEVGIRLLEYELEYRKKPFSEAVSSKIRDVVAYTALNYRHFTTTGQHQYSDSDIQKEASIHRQNWKRDYERWQSYAWRLFDELDRQILPLVAGVVVKLKALEEVI
ncbi:hypothetical protein [Endozoicomonas sp. ISHI1]|uniref:hypothetical protein n=1 Tax=Endozoicomonas sp. ISHI1 TaxID=2825882 RepID=UPI00214849EB|nr:hypothetical protein [Endozoicomonas sp. ISHI1]